jgi:cytochrome o ubiquinol oxidase subunit II
MKKIFKIAIVILLLLGAGALTAFYIGNNTIDVLEPSGMIGDKEKELIVTSSLLMLIVVIPVFILTIVFAWKYRGTNGKAKHAPNWEHNYIAEYCWWGVPIVIIVILAIVAYRSSYELDPFKPLESEKKAISIQVVSLDWKWLFIYPQQGIATVNFVQFPENTPVNFEITSDAPMNSFWIPQLGGQIYSMPAMRSKLHLIANEKGTFKGVSANLSGKGFAGMRFAAVASSDAEFDTWVNKVKSSSKTLDWESYNLLVRPTEYHPVEYYQLKVPDLFDQIIMKYMAPMPKGKT